MVNKHLALSVAYRIRFDVISRSVLCLCLFLFPQPWWYRECNFTHDRDESLYHHIRDPSANHLRQIDDNHGIFGSVPCHQWHSLTVPVFVSAPTSVIINRLTNTSPQKKKNKEKRKTKKDQKKIIFMTRAD